ncbi:MAG: hypothetical protein N2234_09300, partial [Planctomycetota bacterium]|nr:hypothetical protein [Planctomycetota bacterium]
DVYKRQAQYALATCLFHLGEYERVLKIYEELESVALDFPDIHAQKAASYLLLGRPIDALTASMLLLPKEKRSTFRLYFAQALIHIGDKKNAKTVIEGLFKENPCPSLARRARLLLHHLVSK